MIHYPTRYLKGLLAFGTALLAAGGLNGQVTKTFDTDLEGFANPNFHGEQAAPPPEVAWSPDYGGTMALTVQANFNWIARIQTSSGDFFDEIVKSMDNGGSLTFDLIVDPEGLPAGAFQLGISGQGSQSNWNERSYSPISHTAAADGPVTISYSIPIRPTTSRVDGDIAFEPGDTRFDFVLGHRNGNTVPTTVYIDNFTITANAEVIPPPPPPPPPPVGGVVLTFDTDMNGFAKAGWMGGNSEWSPKYGGEDSGSLAITTPGNWQWASQLFLTTGPLFEEIKRSLANGGELVFDVTADSEGVPTGSIQVHLSGNSSGGGWNQHNMLTITQADLTAGNGVATYTVTIPIAAEATPGAINFGPASNYFEFNFGRREGNAGGINTTFYVDNFRVVAGEEPLPPPEPDNLLRAEVITFDKTAEGFSALDFNPEIPRTVAWSANFGGSLLLTYGIRLEPFEGDVFDPWITTSPGFSAPFKRRLDIGAEIGGVVSFDMIAETGVLATFAPRMSLRNNWTQWDGELNDPAQIRDIGDGYERIRISWPLSYFSGLTGTQNQMAIGARGNYWTTGLQFYIDNISMEVAQPAVAIDFSENAAGFVGNGSAQAAHSTEFGGHLAINLPASAGPNALWLTESEMGARFQVSLNYVLAQGGELRFDLIANSGVLAGIQPALFIEQGTGGDLVRSEYTAPGIQQADLISLGGGKELVQIVVPLTALSNVSLDAPYTVIGFGAIYSSATPIQIGLANIVTQLEVSGDPTTTVLTFENGREGFAAVAATAVNDFAREDGVEGKALFIQGPSGNVWQAQATLGEASATAEAAAFGSNLFANAASSGGFLSFEVIFDFLSVSSPTADFDGISILLELDAGGDPQVQEFVFNDVVFPIPSGSVSRTVTVPVYPAESNETDGFVIEPALNYSLRIGSNTVAESASSIEFFIDNLSLTAEPAGQPPIILGEPKLDLSGGIVYGRLLAAFSGDATYDATGLPDGVTLDPNTGLISGTPTANGSFNVVLSVTTSGGTDQAEYEWTVSGVGTFLDLVIVSYAHSDGSFTINWQGNDGTPVVIERSSDLVDWAPVATGQTGTSWTDTETPTSKAFYRIVLP